MTAETGSVSTSRLLRLVRIAGILIGIVAVGLCVYALVREWPRVRAALARADAGWLLVAMLLSVLSMVGLATLWWRVLAVFDREWPWRSVLTWYFAGELGKYLPGGIWTVVGRGELARRAGVRRSVAYSTTLLALAMMCVGNAVVAGVLVPFVAADGRQILGPELLLLVLVPLGLLTAVPAISGWLLGRLRWISKGRVDLPTPRAGQMLSIIAAAMPTWVFVGGASVAIAQALGLDYAGPRIALAAILAWIIGFLAVPIPAGAGVRELVFVGLSGLAVGDAIVVAALARCMLLATDGLGGAIALVALRARRSGTDRSGTGNSDTSGG